jgi:hypothetical protein
LIKEKPGASPGKYDGDISQPVPKPDSEGLSNKSEEVGIIHTVYVYSCKVI